jgi:hypothetical protein
MMVRHRRQLALLGLRGLLIRADPQVDCGPLWLGLSA